MWPGRQQVFHLGDRKHKAGNKALCVRGGGGGGGGENPRDGDNMSPHDGAAAALRPKTDVPEHQPKLSPEPDYTGEHCCFYLIGGICYSAQPLLQSLKHVNTVCACR